jgi:chlorophyll synthase
MTSPTETSSAGSIALPAAGGMPMASSSPRAPGPAVARRWPEPRAVVQLLKPLTWFAPMWALACGVVSAGVSFGERWPWIVGAIVLAGPLVCGTSQAANDYFDRHVDAINEPDRPIPSGRVPGRWGLWIAIGWSVLSLVVGLALGPWVLVATVVGLALAWAYSAPPLRLKLDGWWGNAAVGLCYEGLPWFTGAAATARELPDGRVVALALLYSIGAFGIMVLNDFKSVEGDRKLGIRSLPARYGVRNAAVLACVVMVAPQLVVMGMLYQQGALLELGIVAVLVLLQLGMMPVLLSDPKKRAPLYNATGTTFYVLGMMASAFAMRSELLAGS